MYLSLLIGLCYAVLLNLCYIDEGVWVVLKPSHAGMKEMHTNVKHSRFSFASLDLGQIVYQERFTVQEVLGSLHMFPHY